MQIPKWAWVLATAITAIAVFFIARKVYIMSGFAPEVERTLAIIKPDAVSAKNSGKIIDRIEQEGFTIVSGALEKIILTKEQAEQFYDIHKEREFFKEVVKFMSSGPVIIMVLERANAIKAWRDLMGSTDPKNAIDNTIRNLYGTNITQNAVHGSDSAETAHDEIAFFFPELK